MSISVIIPTLNAEKDLPSLLRALRTQTLRPEEILIVDSESADGTVRIAEDAAGDLPVRVLSVKRAEFDHGKTRDWALRESTGDTVVFLTQDAVPADESFLENLVWPWRRRRWRWSQGGSCRKRTPRPWKN